MTVWTWIAIGFAVAVIGLAVLVIRFAQTHGDEIGVLRERDYAQGGIVARREGAKPWGEEPVENERILPLRNSERNRAILREAARRLGLPPE